MTVLTGTRNRPVAAGRAPRIAAVVTAQAAEFPLVSVLEAARYPLILIGSIANAYFRIKREAPELIVVYLASDDIDGCHLLSMLAVVRETARIPVVTYMLHAADDHDSCNTDLFAQLESSTVH